MGRQLSSFDNITYTYNENGLRTSKTVGGKTTKYYYDGTRLIQQYDGDNSLHFNYDRDGEVIGFTHFCLSTGVDDPVMTEYFYLKNAQGDIIGITNVLGDIKARYTYDPWGRVISVEKTLAQYDRDIVEMNPLLYRGYVYDNDTGLYYLQSRYYDPETGRFINCDDVNYIGVTESEVSYNPFAYCENDPVNFIDDFGNTSRQFLNNIKNDYINCFFSSIALFVTLIICNLKNIYLAFHEYAQVLIASALHLNDYNSKLEQPCINKSKKNGVKEIDVWGARYAPYRSSCYVWEVKPDGKSATKQIKEYIDLCPGYKKGFKLNDISVKLEDDLYFKIKFDGKGGAFYRFTNKSNKKISNKDMKERITYAKNAVIGIGIGILIVICAGAIAATVSTGSTSTAVIAVALKKIVANPKNIGKAATFVASFAAAIKNAKK